MNSENIEKIVYLTSGAAGMYCGSCMHDNTLARALNSRGWDVQLLPTYTPIRTDETDVSVDQVFFGGINIFLQQKIPLLRHVPAMLDRFLDRPWLIRKVTSRALETDPKTLGKLANSMLQGMEGNQRKEVIRLCDWLALEAQPSLIMFTNILIGGCIPEIKKRLGVPVLVTLQGDDVFLDSLPEPYREQCIAKIKQLCEQVDGFLVHSEFYKSYMTDYFSIDPAKIQVTPLGIDVEDFINLPTEDSSRDELHLGYLARMSPEKGLHHLVDAFIELRRSGQFPNVQLKLAGWMGPQHQMYVEQQFQKLVAAGLGGEFHYLGALDRPSKLDFLASLDLFSVPTEFLEPKGLYVLEAMASGVPVVQPDHGSFPELISESRGGLLYEAGNTADLVGRLRELVEDREHRHALALAGRQFVLEHRNAEQMSRSTERILNDCLAVSRGN